jgi:hypothetical protein
MNEKDPEDENSPVKTESEREAAGAEELDRLEAMKEELEGRLASLHGNIRTLQSMEPDRPWLALSESQTSAQRTIDTLRSGTIRSADPEANPMEMAETMETRLQYWQLFLKTANDFCDLYERLDRARQENDSRLAELLSIVDEAERSKPSARIAAAEERKRDRQQHRARRATLTGAKPRPRGGKK